MNKCNIYLSGGSIPWLNTKQSIKLAKETGLDGIELVPFKRITSELLKSYRQNAFRNDVEMSYVKNVHQSWRLDVGHDEEYGIGFISSLFFIMLRFLLFPKVRESNNLIELLTQNLNIPVTVHDISDNWTKDNQGKEFPGGILYEIIGTSINPKKLKIWMKDETHNVVVDCRDDQSLRWAKNYGFNSWQKFWNWIGVKKIKCIQLTFIGINGLKKITKHENSLAEEQLLWLNKKKWKGSVTIEVNPVTLFILYRGNIKKGLMEIYLFVKQTLLEGRKWS
ncbi:MAG: hypothetical protein HYT07_02890 [Candidatus Levybacteria bacterium]|nr:hypothetical protein [Candidatus Levybacteria bacterium]